MTAQAALQRYLGVCPTCKGTGSLGLGMTRRECRECSGVGRIIRTPPGLNRNTDVSVQCLEAYANFYEKVTRHRDIVRADRQLRLVVSRIAKVAVGGLQTSSGGSSLESAAVQTLLDDPSPAGKVVAFLGKVSSSAPTDETPEMSETGVGGGLIYQIFVQNPYNSDPSRVASVFLRRYGHDRLGPGSVQFIIGMVVQRMKYQTVSGMTREGCLVAEFKDLDSILQER